MAKSMNVQLPMFEPTTCADSLNATSSQASAGGRSRSGSPDGLMIDRSGAAPALASHSVRQAKAEGRTTRVTFGRSSAVSFASAALQSSLESRLRARLDGYGSPMYLLTSKHWPIAQQAPIYARRASGRSTSDSDSIGWPTATARDAHRGGQAKRAMGETRHGSNLQDFAQIAGWPTAAARDWKSERASDDYNAERWEQTRGKPLSAVATLTGWPTPMAGTPSTEDYNAAGSTDFARLHGAL